MPRSDTILIGSLTSPLYRFEAGDIRALSGVRGVDVVGDQLSVDELTVDVSYRSGLIASVFAPKGYGGILASDGSLFAHVVNNPDLRKLPYGTTVYHLVDGALWGKYYNRNVERQARNHYAINAISPVGVLDRTKHLGGIYTGQTFSAVVTEIIGGKVPFTVASDVAKLPVYGWLPYASRRSNLHWLLIAYGVAVRRNSAGDMHFAYLADETIKAIPDGQIYYGGNVDYNIPATGAEVTEHSYSQIASVDPVILFDNTTGAAASNTFVAFDQAPVHSLAATGTLRIVSSGPNWARVTGVGTLTGKPYIHTTRTISLEAASAGQGEANVVTMEDCTLISQQNSYNVARRLLSYYSAAKTVTSDIVLHGEGPGDLLSLSDPFYEPVTAFVQSMEFSVSGNVKASCTLITDYTPVKERPLFNRVAILRTSGTYTVPAGVTMLRVAIVQGGDGGASGTYGAAAQEQKVENTTDKTGGIGAITYWYRQTRYPQLGGVGGVAGAAGQGGKVLVVDIPVTPGQKIAYTIGEGGLGGVASAAGSQPGKAGGESTFGSYSSAAGSRQTGGWKEELSGKIYAKPGQAGVAGGQGSGAKRDDTGLVTVPGGTVKVGNQTYSPGASPGTGDVQTIYDGAYNQGRGYYRARAYGAYGGGAAYGANGAAGKGASAGVLDLTSSSATATSAPGGNGATAQPFPDATEIGEGGRGGNGGGGAGSSGVAQAENRILQGLSRGTITTNPPKTPAAPGAGSKGSKGGKGGIFVYYTDLG